MTAAPSFSELALRADFDAITAIRLEGELGEADRWSASLTSALDVRAILSPASNATEIFCVRRVWDRYPDAPPSVVFIDPESGRSDLARVWPTGGPFRPTKGLCVNYTKEGFEMHPEWVNDARLRWRTDGNVLLKILRLLQDDLDVGLSGDTRDHGARV